MRLAVKFTKEAPVRFVSHLDVQRLFQRAFRRARLPLAYSQGFNPHPLISFATALSVGMTSAGEYLDVILTEPMTPEDFVKNVSPHLPNGVRIVEAFDLGDSRKSLTSAMRSARYRAVASIPEELEKRALSDALAGFLSGEIIVQKKTKGGVKPTDIRPMVISASVESCESGIAVFDLTGKLTAEGGLNPDMLLSEFFSRLGVPARLEIERLETELDRGSLL